MNRLIDSFLAALRLPLTNKRVMATATAPVRATPLAAASFIVSPPPPTWRIARKPARAAIATAIALCALGLSAPATFAQEKFPVTQLTAGMYLIQAEVAVSEAQREQGLMFREKMGGNQGMLFIFDNPAGVCMWMKNTILPLSVAFIGPDHRIVNIEDMKPQTTDSHCAIRPALYALEMNVGWFKQKNIKPGMTIEGIPERR